MNRNVVLMCLLTLASLVATPAALGAAAPDWAWWRGPNRNGIATPTGNPPVSWDETANVLWKAPINGRGHSSPVVVQGRVLLTAADESNQVQAVVCYDQKTGQPKWRTPVSRGGFPAKIHNKNTHATPTVAVNGSRIFAAFHNHERVHLTALSLDGSILWQKDAGPYKPKKYQFGYAPSPLIYRALVIVASDFEGNGFLAAFDQETGDEVWRVNRGNFISYSSPIVGHVAGRDQLLISGNHKITSYHPETGRLLWECKAVAPATCGTVIWNDDLVFGSGGYPNKETAAVRGDGSEVVWRHEQKCYEQSMLVYDGFVYAVTDDGIAYCWRAADGKKMWRKRLAGPISASPTLASGNIYASNEKGTTFVFQANPRKFELVAKNQLGTEAFASLAICGDQIFLRVAHGNGAARREMLYCLAAQN